MAEDTEEREDLSMEEILSSIKDILTEDSLEQHQNSPQTTPEPEPIPEAKPVVDDVLNLSPAMMVEPNVAQSAAQPEPASDENTAPEELNLEQELENLPIEPTSTPTEVEHSSAIDEEPINLSDIAAATDDQLVKNSELPDLDFDEPLVDLDAEPIFSAEDDVLPQENFVPAADDASLDNLVDDDTLDAILNTNANEMSGAFPEEDFVEPTDNVYDNAVSEAVKSSENEPVEEAETSAEPQEPVVDLPVVENQAPVVTAAETPAAEPASVEENTQADPIDVSAGIISNFAKMFAEQQKQKEGSSERENLKEQLTEQAMSEIELGDGSLTIEAIVRDVVTGIVEKNLAQDFNFSAVASAEIARQTKEWLNAHLPEIVETAVKKEIERVMAKVSS